MTDMAQTCKIYDAEKVEDKAALGVWRGLKEFAQDKEFISQYRVSKQEY